MTSKLERAIAVHEQWLAAGRVPPIGELLAAHPDLAELLAALLVDEQEVDRSIALLDGVPCELGDHLLLHELGRGGMGVVYRARQLSLDRDVALKVLAGHVTRQPEAVVRFRREAALAARLEHPHIVGIHGVGQQGDTYFFAMELVDGGPLTRRDPRTGALRTVAATVELCAKVADALAHAHLRGVLHRDVKPGNVLVRHDDEPVLTDFGLARQLEDPGVTRSGLFAGTPSYASPEQLLDSKSVDARSDVWSLGATLYELLTGRVPFAGDSAAAVAEQIRAVEATDPRRFEPSLPVELSAIVLKALAKAKDERYASAAAFRDDLLAFRDGRPIAARPVGAMTRTARWLRRHPGWRAAAWSALAAVFLVPLVVTVAVARARDRALAAEQLARRQAYGANLAAASTAIAAGDRAQGRQRLEACPEDLRGREWELLHGSLDHAVWSASTGSRPVVAIAQSRAGRSLVLADDLGAVALWDMERSAELWRVPPPSPSAAVAALAFVPGDEAILVAHADGAVRRLGAARGDLLGALAASGANVDVAIAARGTHVLRSRQLGQLEVFDAGLQPLQNLSLDRAFDRALGRFVADGVQLVASPQIGGLVHWPLAGGQVRGCDYGSMPEQLVAADGLSRVVAFDARTGFTWWDPASGAVQRMHHGARQVGCLDVAPDGRWLCVGGCRGEIAVHDLQQSRLVRTLLGHAAPVTALDVGVGGWTVSGAADGSVRSWNLFADAGAAELAGAGLVASLSGASFGRSLAVDAHGSLFTGGLDGTVRRVEPASGRLLWQRQLPHWVNGMAPLASGELLVTWHDQLQRLAADDGRPVGDTVKVAGLAYVRRLCVAPDGVGCALLDDGGAVALVDTGTGAVVGPRPIASIRTSRSGGLAFAADGALWVGDEAGVVRCLAPGRLAVVATFHVGAPVTALAVDGEQLLIATWDAAARTGRLARHGVDGTVLAAQELPSAVTAMALFDARLALSRLDGRLAVHDRRDLAAIVELPQPASALWNVVAGPAGEWLAVQCLEGEPRILIAANAANRASARRDRALRAAAAHFAAEALQATGWTPRAVRRLSGNHELSDDLRTAAIAALPPPAAWRLRDIALHYVAASTMHDGTSASLRELHECLLESLPIVAAADVASHQVAVALVELRLERADAALARVTTIDGALLSPWWTALEQFVRCKGHVVGGRGDDARAAFAAMQRAFAACEEPPPRHLLHEAERAVAGLR